MDLKLRNSIQCLLTWSFYDFSEWWSEKNFIKRKFACVGWDPNPYVRNYKSSFINFCEVGRIGWRNMNWRLNILIYPITPHFCYHGTNMIWNLWCMNVFWRGKIPVLRMVCRKSRHKLLRLGKWNFTEPFMVKSLFSCYTLHNYHIHYQGPVSSKFSF